MFGYIKPCKSELKVKEYDAYRAVYCGLCRQLGVSFGPFARLLLSYDFTFFCMLAYGVSGGQPKVKICRCCVNPLNKVPMCEGDKVLELGADAAIIMIYYKLLDNIQDAGFFGRLGWKSLRPLLYPAFRKAVRSSPDFDRSVSKAMELQKQVEERRSPSPDEAGEPTAGALGELFALLADDSTQRRVLERLGYLTGRYVYLADAYDDLEEDEKTGGYNPFLERFGSGAAAADEARASLLMTAGEIGKAYELLELTAFRPVLDNIIHLGLPLGADEILSKKENRR